MAEALGKREADQISAMMTANVSAIGACFGGKEGARQFQDLQARLTGGSGTGSTNDRKANRRRMAELFKG